MPCSRAIRPATAVATLIGAAGMLAMAFTTLPARAADDPDTRATALPSGVAMAATWDPRLLYAGGAMIAGEAAAKGFNVLLAGGSNLMRDPRGGRTFEYLGEDPWLTGTLAGAAVNGIQSQHVISTLKHFALAGLDQQSGAQLDPQVFFGTPLQRSAHADPRYAARVADMNRRILRSMFAVGLDTHPPVIKPIDFAADGAVAEQVERAGIVLLRNRDGALPLSSSLQRIAVIGGYADAGVLSGGGSSQVQGPGGPSVLIPLGASAGNFNPSMQFQRSVPLAAIRTRVPMAQVSFRNGRYISDAVSAAKRADVAIVFATQWMTEGLDVPDLSLPNGQDALIAAVAAANPHTIVVLETGGPVLMPWLDQTAAVIEAWYPGARGAQAIAAVLFGDQNPSGRLPVTFPASTEQLPRPVLPGSDTVEPNFVGVGRRNQTLNIDDNIEGADVGYRWFARTARTPLFSFGYGLSYTTFATGGLKVAAGRDITADCTVTNTGRRAGADVVQLYLISAAGQPERRLVGYQRVQLDPGQSQTIQLTVDPRLIAQWVNGGWHTASGHYRWALGTSALDTGAPVDTTLRERRLKP